VLDNCEHLISAVAQLADQVLAACPKVRLLTTSREPLGITGETLCPLPPLALPPDDVTPEQAAGYAAVRLFVDRAVAVHPGFEVDEATVGSVVSIVRRLDGLPLAIELAAARMRAMSPQQIASRLDDRFRLLTGGSRTALPRHRTLLAVVEWSWDLLEKPERLLLQRLAVFAGPVPLETVEAVCTDDSLAREDVLDLVATLVDKSLVDALGSDEVRYRLLETVRAYAADRLSESGEAAVVRDRHAAYLLEVVEQADPLLRSAAELVWLARLDALRDDITAALRWCIDSGQADSAVRFVASMGWYLHLRGMTTEMGHWPQETLALTGEVDPAARAIAQTFAAMGAASDGDLGAGTAALEQAIADSVAVRDRSTHPILALLEPAALLFQLEFAAGMAVVDGIVETHPDLWTRGVALILQGHAMENAGDMAKVAPCYEQAFEIFSEVGERWGQAIALSSLGEIQEGLGNFQDALGGYERALAYLRELGTIDDVTMTLVRLSRMRLWTGDQAGAEAALAEATEIAERFSAPTQAALVTVGYAGIAYRTGELDRAEVLLREVIENAGRTPGFGPHQLNAMVYAALGRVLLTKGEPTEAREMLEGALAHARRSRDVPIIAEVVGAWAQLAFDAGDAVEAARLIGVSTGVRGLPLATRGEITELAEEVRSTLGDQAFDAAYAEGAELDQEAGPAHLVSWAGLTTEQLDALVAT
jgi:predicted ATPase